MTDPQQLDRRLPSLPDKENLVPTKPAVAPAPSDTPDSATTPDTEGPPSEPSTGTDDHLIARALDGPAPPALRDYTSDQLRSFSDRGVPVERARHYRITSVTPEELSLALGWRISSSALRMPVPRNEEASPRYRIDYPSEDIPRYLVAAGVKTHPFVTDLAHDAKEGDVVVIVEAPLKAISLEAVGIRTIGAAGVWAGWRDSETHSLHPDLQSAVRKGCEFVLLFDSDCWVNTGVALALSTLAKLLRQSGADSVRLALLPHARDGSKRGPDDALIQDGVEVLQGLIDNALPSDPIQWLETVSESPKAAALLRSLPFLASLHLLDEPEFDLLVASFRKHKIRSQNVRDARAELRKKLAAKARQGNTVDEPPRYGFDKAGRNCLICTEGDTGNTSYEPLANVGAKVVREEIHDDGAVQSRTFVLEGQLEDGTALPLAEVPAADFSRMDWVYTSWGARAAIVAGSMSREQFRESIQLLSRPEVSTVYGHTGWREIDGNASFLFHGGAIGDQSLSVCLGGFMERFVLPCHASKAPLEGVELVFQLLEVAPHEVTIPLVSAAFLAPLASIVSPDFALWLVGPTGSLKSEMASLAASFFGSFTRLTMGSWSSTENALEAQMFEAKDVVFVIDDYAPQPSPRARAILQEKAARTIRGMGNGSSRSRLRADLTQRPNRPPRCLLICTGEEMPVGASILARLVRIDLDRASIDLAKLTAVQNQRQRLPGVMADYVHHLRHDYPRLKDELPERKVARRARFVTLGGHMRQPEALAMLSLGFEFFLEYAQTTLAIGPNERDSWLEIANKALWRLGEGNAIRMRQGDPVAVFLDSLRELLASGAVCLKPHGMDLDLFPEQHPIGWQDDLHVYLLMQLAHEEVSKLCRSGGVFFGTSVDALRQLLLDAGMLVRPRRGDRLEVSVRAGSKTIRVTKLISTNLNLPASEADETAPDERSVREVELDDLVH